MVVGLDLLLFYMDDDVIVVVFNMVVDLVVDLVWCMLFWEFYEKMIESGIVDLDNVFKGGFVGFIIVVLFLWWFVQG